MTMCKFIVTINDATVTVTDCILNVICFMMTVIDFILNKRVFWLTRNDFMLTMNKQMMAGETDLKLKKTRWADEKAVQTGRAAHLEQRVALRGERRAQTATKKGINGSARKEAGI